MLTDEQTKQRTVYSLAASKPYDQMVTELMTADATKAPPAFCFHVGDVVYFYGEENYYYSQFYEPFKAYPAPIFAIPGNHDGITYNDSMISLDSFQKAFCAPTPARWIVLSTCKSADCACACTTTANSNPVTGAR